MSDEAQNKFKIERYKSHEREMWNAYVNKHPQGSFFHLAEWAELISDVFSHLPHYIVAKELRNGDIVGILPLVEQKSYLFGHSLISTPFCVYGGVLSDSDSIRIALENEALEIGSSIGVDYVELRYRYPAENENFDNFCHHSTFGWQLEDEQNSILAQIKKKQRANVRQSLKKGLECRFDQDVKVAYDIYSESVRNLGTPVFHSSYFPKLIEYFGDKVGVLTILSDKKAVSSVLSFYYKDEVLPYYGGGLAAARELKSNDFMYYELMCRARNDGFTKFDFGRSKNNSGAFKYKSTWGMKAEPLHYLRALVNAKEHPNLSPNNPKYALIINVWKKLPLSLSRAIGPFLSKYLG